MVTIGYHSLDRKWTCLGVRRNISDTNNGFFKQSHLVYFGASRGNFLYILPRYLFIFDPYIL